MYLHHRLDLSHLPDIQLLHRAYGWNVLMPGWYREMAGAVTWQEFLEERKQNTYANFLITTPLGQPVSLVAFSFIGNDDYETHLISKRRVDVDALFDVMATLRDAMFTKMGARMLVAKVADCNVGMKRMLKRLGFEATSSAEARGCYLSHPIRIRLWRMESKT